MNNMDSLEVASYFTRYHIRYFGKNDVFFIQSLENTTTNSGIFIFLDSYTLENLVMRSALK